MENKKTKLTISGTTKKSIRNIEFAKTKGKNSFKEACIFHKTMVFFLNIIIL